MEQGTLVNMQGLHNVRVPDYLALTCRRFNQKRLVCHVVQITISSLPLGMGLVYD